MFFRFLFFITVAYLGYHFLKTFWKKTPPKEEIGGKQRSEPLDFKSEDIEDAHFEDIKDDER